MRRSPLRSLFLALLTASLMACGGSSSSAGSCRHAAAPTTGPGDTLAYFPAEVGRTWQYQVQGTGGTVSVAVTGTQPAGAETAMVFTSSSSLDPTPVSELLVKRPWGVYVLDDGTSDPVVAQTFPELILPFPVAVSPVTEMIRCSSIDVGDLDQDGRSDRADLVETLEVVSVAEPIQVPAGSFTDVAHVRKALRMTVNATSAGSLTVDGGLEDWYARGVGRVVVVETLSIVGGPSTSETMLLTAYAAPTPRLASAGPTAAVPPPPARVAAGPAEPASFEAAALRLAASVLGGRR